MQQPVCRSGGAWHWGRKLSVVNRERPGMCRWFPGGPYSRRRSLCTLPSCPSPERLLGSQKPRPPLMPAALISLASACGSGLLPPKHASRICMRNKRLGDTQMQHEHRPWRYQHLPSALRAPSVPLKHEKIGHPALWGDQADVYQMLSSLLW